jgi:hypothetical protein
MWKKMGYLRLLGLLGLLLLLSAVVGLADLAVGPLSLRLEVSAGESGVGSFRVHNTGSEPIRLLISLWDWWRKPDGEMVVLPPGTLERSLTPWIEFLSPTDFPLEPGAAQEVNFSVTVPEEADGDHWALIVVDQVVSKPEGFQVVVGYAIKVLQTDPATEHKEAQITGLEVASLEPLKLVITFANTGNAHLRTEGYLEVRDERGETVRRVEIEEFPTLPGEVRELVVEMERLPPGGYLALVVLDFGGDYLIARQRPFKVGS